MFTKEQKTRLGVFLAAAAALFVVFLFLLILPHLGPRGERYFVNYRGISVSGMDTGSPVRYQGVEVGTVRRIRVNPRDLNSIIVDIEVQKSFPVKKDMDAVMTYAGITGQKYLELSGGSAGAARVLPGGEIPAGRGLGDKAEEVLSSVDKAVRGVNDLLSPDNQTRITRFLANAEQSTGVVSRLLQSKEESLTRAIANIENASREFATVTANLRTITDDLSDLTARLGSTSSEAMDNLNKRFSDAEMGAVLKNLQAFMEGASSSMRKIETIVVSQQRDIRLTIEGLGTAVDNFSKFSRDIVEDPTLFLRSRREKK